MKKVLVLVVAAALAIAVPAVAGASGAGDAQGPSCGDITAGSGSFGFLGVDQVAVVIDLAAPVCKAPVEYTVTAQTSTGLVVLQQVGQSPNGMTLFFQGTVDPTTNSSVCVAAATTIGNGHHVIDAAPDSGLPCALLPYSSSPGFAGFN